MGHGISGAARRAHWLARWALVLSAGLGTAHAASLEPAVLPRIQAATFEVVSAKPQDDPLRYEKPLPLELLPFQERNDKYFSIGTAFGIGHGLYVTAGHVLLSGVGSLWGPPALRDNQGHVYAIDKVRKFSLEQDFVVFTLAEQPGDAALVVDTSPAPGMAVYSVGNAYGTGVVIRDGLYTSDTPEQQDGRWKWMRFSAAASPGNSGGPLVDNDGKVVGVVLAKSPNENLNYALPIGIVLDAPDGVAELDQRLGYQFDVFDTTNADTLKAQFALPLDLAGFFGEIQRLSDKYYDGELQSLLAKEPARMFPNGEGSAELLHGIPTMGDFPYVIARNDAGTWGLSGETKDDVKLSANGYITPGWFGKSMLFHLRKPDDVPAAGLYGDPSVPMGLLLKSGFLQREVASQKITITSLGKPTLAAMHGDKWGRHWQVWEWPLPYANAMMVVLALPVPDGYVGVLRYAPAAQEHDQLINARALTDFIYVNYDGTLAQWRDYLVQKPLLPDAFKDIGIDFDYGHRFHYASRRVAFDFTPELQAIQPDSVLTLGFAYYADHGAVAWDVGEIWLSARATDDNYIMVVREQAPSPGLSDDYKDDWDRILHRRHRYDAVARTDKDATTITAVVGPPVEASPTVLYTASYTAEGARSQDEMKAGLARLLKTLEVKEP